MTNKEYSLLDAITAVSFIIGILNYEENVDQSTMNKTVQAAVQDIHDHLAHQDALIETILERLEDGK